MLDMTSLGRLGHKTSTQTNTCTTDRWTDGHMDNQHETIILSGVAYKIYIVDAQRGASNAVP